MLVVPLVVFGALEGALRLAGYGYPTSLFRSMRVNGQEYLVENDRFSLRFFPPELARTPEPARMREPKPAGAYRIFILGESVAMGDPAPAFGPVRYLEMLLRERFPGAQFEVVNVAVTAINSHVILPIARECARHDGDLWIIYMGNNEMVGPFGAATVFGAQAPPRSVVRLSLAIKKLRLGQLVDSLVRGLTAKSSTPQSWGGMQMFLGNQVPPSAASKERVYQHFRENLQAILQAGQGSGTRILLNTVAVNLKDCPPFASLSSTNLPPERRTQFERLFAEAISLEAQGSFAEAARQFEQAAGLHSQSAEVEFHWGNCLLRLTNAVAARQHFQRACDLDTLPFRTDSRINGIIRQAALDGERRLPARLEALPPKLILLDAAACLATNSPADIPGREMFCEHVHFNFDGGYRLGRAWAEQVERFLPPPTTNRATPEWASQETCERRLGLTDWGRADVLEGVIGRLKKPPFSAQFLNSQRREALQNQLAELRKRLDPAATARLPEAFLDAINRAPDDYCLHENYADFLVAHDNTKQAAAQWQQVRERFPWHYVVCSRLGGLLAHQGQLAEAEAMFLQAAAERPFLSEPWFERGEVRAAQGKLELALKDYAHALRLQPQDADCYFYTGQALMQLKRRAEAIQNFRRTGPAQARPLASA